MRSLLILLVLIFSTLTFHKSVSASTCNYHNSDTPSDEISVTAVGDIVITEFMNNPNTVSDSDGEWIELYNTTSESIDLIGWTLKDDGNDSHTIGSTLIIPAESYAVLGRNNAGGLIPDYIYGSDIELDNDFDEIVLLAPNGTEIDRVEYDENEGWPDLNGNSLNLTPYAYSFTDNDLVSNWCEGMFQYDLNNYGSPGFDNNYCGLCNIISISADNISECNSTDNTFTADITVEFVNPQSVGILYLTGDGNASVFIEELYAQSSYTFSDVSMNADGSDINITAVFAPNQSANCSLNEPNAGQAPEACPPDNDLCTGAVVINCGNTVNGEIGAATFNDLPVGCVPAFTTRGVWFTFEGTGDYIEVAACSPGTPFPTNIAVFTGSCNELDCIPTSTSDVECGSEFELNNAVFPSQAGVTYYIYLSSNENDPIGSYEVSLNCYPPPANDDVCNAIPLTLGIEENVNNQAATPQPEEVGPGAGTSANSCSSTDGWCIFETEIQNSVWYTFDNSQEGCYEIITSDSDLQLAIYTATECSNFSTFSEIGANDNDEEVNGNSNPSPGLTLNLPEGLYYIQVDGYNGTTTPDDFILISPSDQCPSPCNSYNLDLSIDMDNFPNEVTWELLSGNGEVVNTGGPYASGIPNVTEMLCSDPGCYEFTIYDSFGDGICCNVGMGSYTISLEGELLYESDGQYGFSENTEICIGSCPTSGYTTTNLGTAPTEGTYDCEEENGAVITSSGQNGSTPTDNMSFLHQELCGDGYIVAKIESVSPNGYGGLSMRDGTADDDKAVNVFSDLMQNILWETRYTTGGAKIPQNFVRPFPFWLKLERQGDWFFGYYSTTGPANFQYVHAVNVQMDQCIEVGLAVFSFIVGQDAEVVFSNIETGGGIAPLGAPQPGLEINYSSFKAEDIRLFPNPASNTVTIDYGTTIDRPTTMVLRNKLGQLIEQRRLEIPAMRSEWDVSGLIDGLYMIEIHIEDKAPRVLRFVKD